MFESIYCHQPIILKPEKGEIILDSTVELIERIREKFPNAEITIIRIDGQDKQKDGADNAE